MTVVDAIHDLNAFNLIGNYNNAALSTVPLTNYTGFTQNLTGTVTVAAGATQVTGTGTQFTTELKVGGIIQIGTQTFTVSAIASNTQLTLSQTHTAGATAVTAKNERSAGERQLRDAEQCIGDCVSALSHPGAEGICIPTTRC